MKQYKNVNELWGAIVNFWTHRRKLHFRRSGYRYGQSKRKKKPQKRKA